MKIVYLSTWYRTTDQNTGYDTQFTVFNNWARSQNLARIIWKMGAACINPIGNTAFFHGDDIKDEDGNFTINFLEGDCEMIRRCDAVYFARGWDKSHGCKVEHEFALKHNIPVFYDMGDLSKWLIEQEVGV